MSYPTDAPTPHPTSSRDGARHRGVASRARLLLGVDGGNSKTDLLLIDESGGVLAGYRGPSVSHQAVGLATAAERLHVLVERLLRDAGRDAAERPEVAVLALAGADTPSDMASLREAHAALAPRTVIMNDAFAALRAGSRSGWGVVVICGAGVNAAGIAPDGRTARFPALGAISGDAGGGYGLGLDALRAAVRALDGRGQRTRLEELVPRHFGLRRPLDVTYAMYEDAIPESRLPELAPIVFQAAHEGDEVATRIVAELSDELARMALSIIRRLRLVRREVEVVLAGGVFNAAHPELVPRLERTIGQVAPGARVGRLEVPPVVGSALVALERLGSLEPAALARGADRLRTAASRRALVS
jgi:N-acetylglucosamine kinase-like BadF-type ATPase